MHASYLCACMQMANITPRYLIIHAANVLIVLVVIIKIISRLCVENAQCRTLLLNLDNSISGLTTHTSISGFWSVYK